MVFDIWFVLALFIFVPNTLKSYLSLSCCRHTALCIVHIARNYIRKQ